MSLSPEESQQLTNLQRRILGNISQGKASSQDISAEEIADALKILRGDRAKALQAGAAKAPRKTKASVAAPSPQSGLSLEEKLRARGLGKTLAE